MLHYRSVKESLTETERILNIALKSTCDTEKEKEALNGSLLLIKQAKELCRLAQADTINQMIEKQITNGL